MRAPTTIVVIDFGSQYSQLICRRIRELQVPAEMVSWTQANTRLQADDVAGIILSGGPDSVYEVDAPTLPSGVLARQVPVLGICYGMQLLVQALGGRVAPGTLREYGHAELQHTESSVLFQEVEPSTPVWMSHGDRVEELPAGVQAIGFSAGSPYAALMALEQPLFGLQFHPEVQHTAAGMQMLRNFVFTLCEGKATWTPTRLIEDSIARIRSQVPAEGQVICALSGGVDSAVAAALVHEAVGSRLTCVFVNNGLLRKHEAVQVPRTLQAWHPELRLRAVDATEEFLSDLEGVTDPEIKRQYIGHRFIRVFEREISLLTPADDNASPRFLVQGTIYPDVIESASGQTEQHAHTIKTHHNVGGLPENLELELIEPLRWMFKDEVRRVGRELGLPAEILMRHPFPGPGLAVRILGEVTWERLERLRDADAIFMEELWNSGQYAQTDQAFAVLLPVQTVGVMGDLRTYQQVIALRAVSTSDFMTADWTRLPMDVVAKVSQRIVNEVPGINRVVYDVSSKPPATIEWE